MSDLVRVSCSGLAYVQVDGFLAGVISRGRRAKGVWFLTPIGGKHNYHAGTERLFSDWDAQPVDSKTKELVLRMPRERVERFREWYVSGSGREEIPLRELGEELVDEEKVFPSRDLDYVLDSGFIFSKVTPRVGLDKGEETQYFFDAYRFSTPDADKALCSAAARPDGNIRLITRAEAIMERMNRPGLPEHEGKVGDMFKFFGLERKELDALVAAQPKEMNVKVSHLPNRSYAGPRLG